jgi:hypothetical protein
MLTIDTQQFRFIRSAEFDSNTQALTITIVCTPDDIQRSSSIGVDNVDDELLDVVNLVPAVMRKDSEQ